MIIHLTLSPSLCPSSLWCDLILSMCLFAWVSLSASPFCFSVELCSKESFIPCELSYSSNLRQSQKTIERIRNPLDRWRRWWFLWSSGHEVDTSRGTLLRGASLNPYVWKSTWLPQGSGRLSGNLIGLAAFSEPCTTAPRTARPRPHLPGLRIFFGFPGPSCSPDAATGTTRAPAFTGSSDPPKGSRHQGGILPGTPYSADSALTCSP